VATLRKRSNGHWQARVRKANQSITKTFINKVDAERCYEQLKTRGRPPSGYTQLDLTDPEQLALTILKTLPK
jgi:hypothetical protein